MNQRAVDQKHKRTLITFIGLSLVMGSILLITSGCSVYMAAKQPGQKDLSVLKEGTPRSHVIAELGAPVWSGEKNGNKVDMFAFTQGYSAGAKAGRAFFHGAADFFTLGLWEVIGTPVESVASGTDIKVEVTYDANDRVKLAEIIERKEAKPEQTGEAKEGEKPKKAEPAQRDSVMPTDIGPSERRNLPF